MKRWNDVNALYEIYPLSFRDTTGDGFGDIPGIIEKIPYLANELGVDAVWLAPMYPSPMADCGYDVSNYCEVNPLFGTMRDMERLIEHAHAHSVKVMLDFVPNHTSDQHDWFKESRSSRDNPKRDWYVWRDQPNNWVSMAGGSSWEYDDMTGQYYLHTFMKNQPDLNWDNPDVRAAMKDQVRFWFDRGIDGFRVDAVWPLSKSADFADDPHSEGRDGRWGEFGKYVHTACKNGPNLLTYLSELSAVTTEYDDRFMVFEYYPEGALGDPNEQYYAIQNQRPEASSFYFEGMSLPFEAAIFADALKRYFVGLSETATPIISFGNHDQSRMVTRFGGEQQARLITFLQMTLPGMPQLYYGDELGMADVEIDRTRVRDNFEHGGGMGGRDPERTPMQWDSSEHAGFSKGDPWLPIGHDYQIRNVDHVKKDTHSMWAFYQRLLQMRRDSSLLRHGKITVIDSDVQDVMMFERQLRAERYLVVLNFANDHREIRLGEAVVAHLFGTHPLEETNGSHHPIHLQPYEGVILSMASGEKTD